ncbi:hypothetical protein OEZ85_011165 [Tetradesmus obliquus]|uniref:EamA domain-containing protein n=1 Tax=Tetradesmus obliquus TaxID=3088 RepID=A0ABY8TTC0_TETOB|nr:hypothetical protein OEZ85_011165 [Tetradesmus obliquus]
MEHAQEPRKPLSGRALGLVLIFLTAIIWVAASFISQLLVNTEEGKPSYNVSPFLLTYLSTSIFTVFLPLVQLKNLLQETRLLRRSFKYKPLQQQDAADEEEEQLPLASPAAQQQQQQHGRQQQTAAAAAPGSLEADIDLAEAAAAAEQASAVARASAVAHKESFIAAAQCFMFWFIAQYLFNLSLSMTSVTSNTILSSSSSLFTFALSMVVLKEPWSCAKLLSIAACMGGTLLVTLSDNHSGSSSASSSSSNVAAMGGNSIHSLAGGAAFNSSSAAALNSTLAAAAATAALNGTAPVTPASAGSGASHSVTGDLLCLTSACFYACYTIVLRKSLPDDDEANVALFFGYVGVLCSVVFAPVVAILAGLGSMHLKSIPPKAYLIILIEGILNYCLSDYLWAHAVLLLGPTIATLGLSVQIPVAAVVEVLMGTPKWLSSSSSIAMTLSGTSLIMAGFFAGNLAGGGSVVGSHHRGDLESGSGRCCYHTDPAVPTSKAAAPAQSNHYPTADQHSRSTRH